MSVGRTRLTRKEQDEYDRRRRAAEKGDTKALPGDRKFLFGALVWLAFMLAALSGAFTEKPLGVLASIPISAAAFVLMVWLVGASIRAYERSKLRGWADEYLVEIGYHTRAQAPLSEPSSDEGEPLKSRRQLQHEWYGGHSELNWQDRERAEMYGMDVETYISNVLENDKD